MGIFVGKNTRVIVQGITGNQGRFHTKLMIDYGTNIVAGVTPWKHGSKIYGVPVYDDIAQAMEKQPIDASVVFVPAPFVLDAVNEAINSGIETIVVITEGIKAKDALKMMDYAAEKDATIIGPNTPGILVPGECKLGIMPSHLFRPGPVGIVSRSGTLTYEIAAGLTNLGIGQSTCVGLGGDVIIGLTFVDLLKKFAIDDRTKAVVLIGEIGGNLEEVAADYIKREKYDKPVVAYVAGRKLPPEERMGHAGAILMGDVGTAESKMEAFRQAGVDVAHACWDVLRTVMNRLK